MSSVDLLLWMRNTWYTNQQWKILGAVAYRNIAHQYYAVLQFAIGDLNTTFDFVKPSFLVWQNGIQSGFRDSSWET